jgi:hypothetical protein
MKQSLFYRRHRQSARLLSPFPLRDKEKVHSADPITITDITQHISHSSNHLNFFYPNRKPLSCIVQNFRNLMKRIFCLLLWFSWVVLFIACDFLFLVGRPEVAVLRGVRCVNQQPPSKPEMGDEGGDHEQGGDSTVVPRPEQEEARIQDVARSSNEHDVSHPTGEDTPEDDSESEQTEEDTGQDL